MGFQIGSDVAGEETWLDRVLKSMSAEKPTMNMTGPDKIVVQKPLEAAVAQQAPAQIAPMPQSAPMDVVGQGGVVGGGNPASGYNVPGGHSTQSILAQVVPQNVQDKILDNLVIKGIQKSPGTSSKILQMTQQQQSSPTSIGNGLANFMQSFGYGAVGKDINMGTEKSGWQSALGGMLGKNVMEKALFGEASGKLAGMYNTEKERQAQKDLMDVYRQKEGIKNEPVSRWGDKTPDQVRTELQTKDPARLAFLEKLAKGEVKMAGRGSKYMAQTMEDAGYLFPGLDQSKIESRYALRKDFSTGKAANNIRSLNTAVQHLNELNDLIPGLDNGRIKKFNTVKNWLANETGKPEVAKFKMVKTALSGELASIFKNSGATDQEIKNVSTAIDSSSSREQLDGVVKEAVALMHGRMAALEDQWGTAFDGEEDQKFPVVSKRSQAILDKLVFGVDDKAVSLNDMIAQERKRRAEK